jgi:hypothetical protein
MSTLNVSALQGPSSTGTAAVLSSLNGGPLAGFRNRIINGDMRIAQRGTSFAAIASGSYGLDRWQWGQTGAMVCTISQSTDVPNNAFQNSYKVDVTTADASIAAGEFTFIRHRIEGYNVRDLIGQSFTISFWVKSPKTGIHCVMFSNLGADRSYVLEYAVSSANTWEHKSLTVNGGLITAGTWDWTNGSGLNVHFVLACGSTFQTTADAWQTGNFVATANQVNVMDNAANDFFLTGVQLEPGPIATPFEQRPFGSELALCQRYFCRVDGEYKFDGAINSGGTSVSTGAMWYFPVSMRTLPNLVTSSEVGTEATTIAWTPKATQGALGTWAWTNTSVVVTRTKAAIVNASAEL